MYLHISKFAHQSSQQNQTVPFQQHGATASISARVQSHSGYREPGPGRSGETGDPSMKKIPVRFWVLLYLFGFCIH
jgi:hypothetical protein